MYYRDLVQFDPIESIIQLREADEKTLARQLVETYVISDRMAEHLVNLVLPQLQFERPQDNKGVLIVGNYGTGKSHLLAVLSSIAEYDDLAPLVDHPAVQEAAASIAGRFKVVRTEIGGVTGSLRDILLRELETALAAWGTPYTFPAADQVTNNKDALIAAVEAFRQKYPDHGLLLVVDELLDYLRTRDERALILDLGFLRELGEVAALTPFRFVGGVQETLFDNPRFAFVAQQLRRVRDRFEQVRIAREDIAYVVAHRLLRKDDKQLAWITEHLRQFTPLYGELAERLEDFAQLFPVHPAYLETFERVYVAEKREVLKTLSSAMRARLDEEVPEDRPGVISYDHYWPLLCDDPSLRALPAVAEVADKSAVLAGRVRHAYTREHLLPLAERIIAALSVQRLTTPDIRAPLGVTAEELRDGLCLYTPLPTEAASAEFLLGQVQVALQEIMRTVSGQYITHNEENGQYYLDVDKDVDFAAKIEERGNFLSDDDLNRYFFDALQRLLNLSTTTYVTGYRIWAYELPWVDHKVTRPGYLFFGAPDDRSTAQPPRDFYLYILPPYLGRDWHNPERPDEVIISLTGLGQDFRELVTHYAGARAMADESADYRQKYANHADDYLRKLVRWLREHLIGHMTVIYEGVTQPARAVLAEARSTASQNLEDLLRIVGQHLLAPHFEEKYPDYPRFPHLPQPITEAARPTSAMEAVRYLAGRGRTRLAQAVLEGLQLVDVEGNVRPYDSPYALAYVEKLQAKAAGQVVNRGELIEQVAGGVTPVEKGHEFQLEPEWIVVALLALVYHGDIVLNLDGRETLDAGSLERAALFAMADLVDFRFYKAPRTLPLNLWVTIFEGLGLPPGLIRDENTRAQAIRDHLQPTVAAELEATAKLEGQLQQGVQVWNKALFTDRHVKLAIEGGSVQGPTDAQKVTLASTDLLAHVRGYKKLLETLRRFNTVGKLRNLRMTLKEIHDVLADREVVGQARALLDAVADLQPLTSYLAEAQANLPLEHPWSQQAKEVRDETINTLRRMGQGEATRGAPALRRTLEALKRDYVAAYSKLHRQLVLSPQADQRRVRLYDDPRRKALQQLAKIDLLSSAELTGWEQAISNLPICPTFHEGAIDQTPTCPACQLRPAQHSGRQQAEKTLNALDSRVDELLVSWRQALRDALESEAAQESRQAMAPDERAPLEAFLDQPDDATTIPAGFVDAATQALRGITALTLRASDLLAALKEGGMPCTVQALEQRFTAFVARAMRGHDRRNTRVKLEE